MSIITKEDIESIVVEIAEKVYNKSNIDLNNKELEPIISNMRYETEQIITQVINFVLEIVK